ncbi:MAG: hypothetical protein ACLS9F_17660 [Clostridium paraputrificum]
MKKLLQKIALSLTLIIGTMSTSAFASTTIENNNYNFTPSENAILEKISNPIEIKNPDGSITRIIEIPELNLRDEYTISKDGKQVTINNQTFDLDLLMPNLKNQFNIENENINLKIRSRAPRTIQWVYQVTTTNNVPIGITVSAGLSILSIKTGIPAKKLTQKFMVVIGIPLSSILNNELKVQIKQYRSKYKIDGRYKYKHVYNYMWKTKTFHSNSLEFYTERPY